MCLYMFDALCFFVNVILSVYVINNNNNNKIRLYSPHGHTNGSCNY